MKTKVCKQCQKEFQQYITINGRALNLARRSYCLICSPFGELKMNRKPVINGERECLGCKTFKPLKEFALRKSGHFRSYCLPCEVARTIEYGRQLKRKAIAYLGGKCVVCDYARSMRGLCFHHKDPTQKRFELGKRRCLNWDDTKLELDKCVLLCANCHAEVHEGLITV